MPAISVAQVRAHPGKANEFIAIARDVAKVQKAYGLTARLFTSQMAGANTGVISYVVEAPDLAALGAAMQQSTADPAFQALAQRAFGADGVATLLNWSQATEVPL